MNSLYTNKLYWRVKRNGKYTWRPVAVEEIKNDDYLHHKEFQWYLLALEEE